MVYADSPTFKPQANECISRWSTNPIPLQITGPDTSLCNRFDIFQFLNRDQNSLVQNRYQQPAMKSSFVLLLIIANLKRAKAPCIVHPSPSGCATHNPLSNVMLFGTSYCACSTCSAGKMRDPLTIACCTSLANCVTCIGSNTGACLVCATGFAVAGTTCSPCSTVIPNCLACTSAGVCTSCKNSSYVLHASGATCHACSFYMASCTTCTSNTTCTQCSTGYALSGIICQPCSVIPNCLTCSSIISCTTCINTYAVSAATCDLCSNLITNCVTCLTNSICTSCLGNTLAVHLGACVPCNAVLTGCNLCSSNITCIDCISGYALTGAACQTCSALMTNCVTCSSSTVCTSCISNNIYTLLNGACVLCSVALPNCTSCVSNTTCTLCPSNTHALWNGQCLMCYDRLAWCIDCASNTTCNQCSAPAYMMPSSTCMWCAFKISYCTRCFYNSTPATGITCTQCDSNHVLDVSGSGYCYSCQSLMTACHACYSSPTLCYACLNESYAVNTTATPNTCIPCSSTLSYCVRCLNLNECIECTADSNIYIRVQHTYNDSYVTGGSYSITKYTGVSGICDFCNLTYPLCSVCNDTQCIKCEPTKSITLTSLGTCNYCLNLIVGCEQCFSETECFQCKNSMLTIVSISPTVRICKLCCDIIFGCLTCSSPKVCTRCSIGVIVNGSCSSVAGCALVGQTGNSPSRCLKCLSPEFYPQVVLQSCICQKGHIAGCCCTQITGCTAIHRTATQDICTSCNTNLNFQSIAGTCRCIANYVLAGDRCEETCGDGIMFDQQCDDGNKQDFDGCSSLCKVQEHYECRGGSSTTPSICRLASKISLTVIQTRKEATKNRLIVVTSINPPTKLIKLLDFSTKFHYTPADRLTLVSIDVTHEFITISFDYLQDLPQLLATMWIDLDTVHFIQSKVQTHYLLKTTSGQPLYYDPWAGSDYLGLKNTLIYLSLSAILISTICTISYKMIGVQTIHIFQLIFFGMIFSRRYSNYFHNFDELMFTEGQTSSLFPEQKVFVSYKLSFMRYCDLFEANLVVVASTVVATFCVWAAMGMLKKIWEDRMDKFEGEQLRKIVRQKDSMGKIRRLIHENILLPLCLGFFFHVAISCICQSYKTSTNQSSYLVRVFRTIAKTAVSSIILFILSDELTKAFFKLMTEKVKGKYKNVVYQRPLEPHEPAYKYVAFYIAATFSQGLLTLSYLFFDLPFYIEVNLLISIIRLTVLLVTRPYQMAIHNWAICYNALVLVIGFTWFLLEQFYLLSPSITKIFAYILLGCLSGVLAMAVVRTLYNFWFKYKEKTQDIPQLEAGNEASKDKTDKQQKLLGTKKGNYLNRRRRQMIESDESNQKNKQLEIFIKEYKLNFKKSIKIPVETYQSR